MNGITEMAEAVNEILEELGYETFSDVERGIQQILKEVGQTSVEEWTRRQTEQDPMREWKGEAVRYDGRRPARTKSIYGWVRYERDYYRYTEQGGGVSPFDEEWGMRPNAMSAELERLAALYGVELPFEKGSRLLEETLHP